MERQSQNFHAEVDGVASQVALGPAPIAIFDDEAGIGEDVVVRGIALTELEAASLEEWNDGGEAGLGPSKPSC